MSIAEIKTEIQQVIDQLPETALQDVLAYLSQFRSNLPYQTEQLEKNLKKILLEDRELLNKLAQ